MSLLDFSEYNSCNNFCSFLSTPVRKYVTVIPKTCETFHPIVIFSKYHVSKFNLSVFHSLDNVCSNKMTISGKFNLTSVATVKSYSYSKLVICYGGLQRQATATFQWNPSSKSFTILFGMGLTRCTIPKKL